MDPPVTAIDPAVTLYTIARLLLRLSKRRMDD